MYKRKENAKKEKKKKLLSLRMSRLRRFFSTIISSFSLSLCLEQFHGMNEFLWIVLSIKGNSKKKKLFFCVVRNFGWGGNKIESFQCQCHKAKFWKLYIIFFFSLRDTSTRKVNYYDQNQACYELFMRK